MLYMYLHYQRVFIPVLLGSSWCGHVQLPWFRERRLVSCLGKSCESVGICMLLQLHVQQLSRCPKQMTQIVAMLPCFFVRQWTATGAVAVRAAWPTASWIGIVAAQDCTYPWHMPSFRAGVCCMRLAHLSYFMFSTELSASCTRIVAIDATSFFNCWHVSATWCAVILCNFESENTCANVQPPAAQSPNLQVKRDVVHISTSGSSMSWCYDHTNTRESIFWVPNPCGQDILGSAFHKKHIFSLNCGLESLEYT